MDETTQKTITRRLASAAGHIKGIERMAQEGTYCIDMIQQIQAVQAALHKVSAIVLESHMQTCMIAAVHDDDPAEREKMLREVVNVFDVSNKR
jgi:DNA-binding FrmR family transcriptional regulator